MGMLISKAEFCDILRNREATKALHEVGVDVVGLVDFVDFIFGGDDSEADGTTLTFSDFMDVVLQLRGSNTATVKDVVDLRKFITAQFQAIQALIIKPPAREAHSAFLSTSENQVLQERCNDGGPDESINSPCVAGACGGELRDIRDRLSRVED